MKDFIGIIGTISGVIIGGLITLLITWFQFRKQEKQRKYERKINAYEEIHKHLSTLDHEAGYSFLQISLKVSQGVPIDNKERVKLPWQELEMLINFYTPELKEDIKIIQKKWGDMGQILELVVMEKYTQKVGPKKMRSQPQEISNQIKERVTIAKNKLAKLANRIV